VGTETGREGTVEIDEGEHEGCSGKSRGNRNTQARKREGVPGFAGRSTEEVVAGCLLWDGQCFVRSDCRREDGSKRGGKWSWDELDRSNKAIAAAANSLNEARCIGIIGEYCAEFVDGFINGMFEIQVDTIGPEGRAKLLACYEFSIVLEQERENLGWLGLQSNTPPCLPQLEMEWVEPKIGKYR